MILRNRHVLRSPDDEAGGGAAVATPPAAAPAAASPAPAAPAPQASAPAAPAPAATPAAPAAAPATAATDWPDDWREKASKGDPKIRDRLGRYASPVALADALIAAQNRISAGELKPVLSKDATPEQLKEWRAAHGIPDAPDKYALGNAKFDESEKPVVSALVKAMHDTNATPEVVKAVAETLAATRKADADARAEADNKASTASEDALRAEWGTDFRKNMNLISGLLDATASPQLKESIMQARMPDGTLFGSSPDVLRMLVSLSLIQNPTGTVVPGGVGETGENLRSALDKLQKIPANKKTEEQSAQQRDLINAAIKGGFMDGNGNWISRR